MRGRLLEEHDPAKLPDGDGGRQRRTAVGTGAQRQCAADRRRLRCDLWQLGEIEDRV